MLKKLVNNTKMRSILRLILDIKIKLWNVKGGLFMGKYKFLFFLLISFLSVNMFLESYCFSGNSSKGDALRLNVPTFVQHFEPWKEQQYGFGERTIEYAGCALTSLSMLLKYNNVDTNPKHLNNYLKSNSGFEGRENIRWSIVDSMSNGKLSFSKNVNFANGADLELIKRQIEQGNPVIARVDYQQTNHFVLICGYYNDTFFINDPWTEDSSKTINEGFEPYGNPRESIKSVVLFESNSASKDFVPVVQVSISKFHEPIVDDFLPVVSFQEIQLTIDSPFMSVGGKVEQIDESKGVTPIILNGRTYLPIRAIAEAIGAKVRWEDRAKKIEIIVADRTVEMWLGKRQAFVNGHPFPLDVKPIVNYGRSMIPIRPLIERLGGEVFWDDQTRMVTIVSNFRQANEDDIIKTDDENLENALRHILQMPTGDILYSDFENKKIDEIWISDVTINDLKVLGNLRYLRGLYLNNNGIYDIENIASLTNIENLELRANNIIDISSLKNLENLVELNLTGNEVEDISALKNLSNIRKLNLSNNNVTDITALRGLEKLEYINLNGNSINNYEVLKSLENLEVIRIKWEEFSLKELREKF